jgi:C4-dicarboxylate-specific signal transduction histidine kinase
VTSEDLSVGTARVLIVDDDVHLRSALQVQLQTSGHQVATAANGTIALRLIEDQVFDAGILDLHLPDMSGIELLKAIHARDAALPCILLTGFGTIETAVEALRQGAYDYLTKTAGFSEVSRAVTHAIEHGRLLREKQVADAILERRSQELSTTLDALHETRARLLRTGNAALMGQLAEGLRHELGNALTVIRLNINLVTHYRNDLERFNQHMTSLEQGVQAIERITMALRYFPTDSARTGEVIDLVKVLRHAAREAQQAHPEFTGTLVLDLPDTASVFGTQFQLLRVFIGIIENAIEACLLNNDSTQKVTLALSAESNGWRVSVRDTGPGLTDEALEHAVEPGFTTKIERGFMRGLGLGLFVANGVLATHGGYLRLSNAVEDGALVEAWLPNSPFNLAGMLETPGNS